MKKSVYLFELDSVRFHEKEIKIGLEALFGEIIHNENTVVLTFNQLVDSNGFFSLLDTEEYRNNIIKLFECGAIQISQYDDIRTISQYMINKLNIQKEEESFIFSAWPLNMRQRRLVALIKRSLIYSDLSEIFSYIGSKEIEPTKTELELRDLFTETSSDGKIVRVNSSKIGDLRNILENLYGLLKTVLRLSSIHTIYVPPRDKDEYSDLLFPHIMEYVLKMAPPSGDKNWADAKVIINSLESYQQKKTSRSDYVRELRAKDYKASDKIKFCYAEAIINLVYNYTCEISICDISKHYNVEELRGAKGNTFRSDFIGRLNQYWDIDDREERFLKQPDKYCEYNDKTIEQLAEATARIIDYSDKEDIKSEEGKDGIYRYEYELDAQKKDRKKQLLHVVWKKVFITIIGVSILFFLNCFIGSAQDLVNSLCESLSFKLLAQILPDILIAAVAVIFFCATEGITVLLSRYTIVKPLAESVVAFEKLHRDRKFIKDETRADNLYRNYDTACPYKTEPLSKKTSIDFIKSDAVKKYIQFKKDPQNKLMFTSSKEIPIADISEPIDLKELTRCEELYGYKFGIVYESKYNRLVVDPIKTWCNKMKCVPYECDMMKFEPYERVIPIGGNGVVMVTRTEDKFIVLRQFRHAPRKEQWCFPRGHGENGILSIKNAEKELEEEIGAVISKKPVFLGRISPDSGLTSSCASVYLVDVDQYSPYKREEGIREIVEVNETFFEELLQKNSEGDESTTYDDGYTIAAYMLYKKHMSKCIENTEGEVNV